METHVSDTSDDEIFIGNKIVFRELKRCVQLGRRTMSVITVSDESEDDSVELIEAHSEPELLRSSVSPELASLSPKIQASLVPKTPTRTPRMTCRRSLSQPDLRESVVPQSWETKVSDDSFLAMESLIANTSTHSEDLERFEDLLRVDKDGSNVTQRQHKETINKPKHTAKKDCAVSKFKKPFMGKLTMNRALKDFENHFKTPITPNTQKGPQSAKKTTPMRSPVVGPSHLRNIESPIAFYIRNSPRAPLVQTVRPRRPLPGMSAIPKRVDLATRTNKENVSQNLPPTAYVAAKQTKILVTPDRTHLPRNKQVREMASALTHPTVMRHERREKLAVPSATLPAPDESFAKLNISQAEVSVCVVKSAEVTKTLKYK